MTQGNTVRAKLLQLDGGAFQRLCDDWLFKKGYENINAIGMTLDSNKVTTGTPDSLLIQDDGKYIFSEYTVQQTGLVAKIHDDIDKCLNESKTGIKTDEIPEIVYCYLGKLSSQNIAELREKTEKFDIKLTLNGIDTIALSLENSYPILLEKHLGIPLTTGQILDTEDFIALYNQSEFATPIGNKLLYRDELLTKAITDLENTSITLISGPAGVGKTGFSIELLKQLRERNKKQKLLCVYDKGADLTRDITSLFSENGEYVVFVDDANRLDNRIDYLLHQIHSQTQNKSIKLIITVRDYAREQLSERLKSFSGINLIELTKLSDDEIKGLIEELYGITNSSYQRRIQEISNGNPRIAIMASKVAVKEQRLESIQNVSDLYDEYFGSHQSVRQILNEPKLILIAGFISIVRKVDRHNAQHIEWIKKLSGIQVEEFWEYVNVLHSKELVDLYEHEVVRISDQVLSTYLFYFAVFKSKLITFESLLETFFPQQRQTLIDALNPALSAFNHREIIHEITRVVRGKFNDLKNKPEQEVIFILIDCFWFSIPTETLLFIKQSIDSLEKPIISWEDHSFKGSNSHAKEGSIVRILSHFRYYDEKEFEISFELMLKLLIHSKESLSYIIHELLKTYSYHLDDLSYGCAVQKHILEKLLDKTERGGSFLFSKLFLAISSHYLEVEYRRHEMARDNRTIHITTFKLPVNEYVLNIREKIFEGLSTLMDSDTYRAEVNDILSTYIGHMKFNGRDMTQADCSIIERTILPKLSHKSTSDAFLIRDFTKVYDELNIEYISEWNKHPFHECINLADLILEDRNERRFLEMGHDEYEQYITKRIRNNFSDLTLESYKNFLNNALELNKTLHASNKTHGLRVGLERAHRVFGEQKPDLFVAILSTYLGVDSELRLDPSIMEPFMKLGKLDELQNILCSVDFPRKHLWWIHYYVYLPASMVDRISAESLLKLLHVCEAGELYRNLSFLDKYLSVDQEIFVKSTRILLRRAQKDKAFISPLDILFNSYGDYLERIFELFKSDSSLIYQSYIKLAKWDSSHFDYNGKALEKISAKRTDIIFELIDAIYEIERFPSSHTHVPSLSFLWRNPNYLEMIDELGIYIMKKESSSYFPGDNIFIQLFHNQNEHAKDAGLSTQKNTFMKYAIEKHHKDHEYMQFLFFVIVGFDDNSRKELLAHFLKFNDDFEAFKLIEFEPRSASWTGSMVPMLQKQRDFLLLILPLFKTSSLLEHRALLEQLIENKNRHIQSEKKRDFIESQP